MKHLRIGNGLKLKTDFRITGFDLGIGKVHCTMYERTEDSATKVDFILPLSCPVFGFGPFPYTRFKHPTHLSAKNPNFCAWVNRPKNEVYYQRERIVCYLTLEDSFYLDGRFRLTNRNARETFNLVSEPSDINFVSSRLQKTISDKLLISGDDVSGIILDILVRSKLDDSPFVSNKEILIPEEGKKSTFDKKIVKYKLSFDNYCEWIIDHELTQLK